MRRAGLTRRALLAATGVGGAGLTGVALLLALRARADDEASELLQRLTGRVPTASSRVRLLMPSSFPSGYTVPLTLEVDSPMTEADHVRRVRVIAPRNPIIEVADFHFTPQSGRAHVSTRIRLAEPQFVLAVAEMSDDGLLMTKTWVKVDTNGCA